MVFFPNNKYFLSSCSSDFCYSALSLRWFQWISFYFSNLQFILNLWTSVFYHLYLLLLPLPDPFFSFLHLDFLPYLLASLLCILLYFSILLHVISSDFYFILFHLSFIVSHQLFNPFIVIHLLLDFLLPFLLKFFIKILPSFILSVY